MLDSFGDLLLQFARSVDYLENDDFIAIRKCVDDYTRDTLKITSTRFLVASKDGQTNEARLTPLREIQTGRLQSIPIYVGDGYSGQAAFSVVNDVRLWVVADEPGESLSRANGYRDLWSEREDLPEYRSIGREDIKTSIIIPTRNERGEVFGVLNFETSELLGPTDAAKSELSKIATTLAMSYVIEKTTYTQRKNTSDALRNVQEMGRRKWPKLTKPKVFLASSSEADKDVLDVIEALFATEEFKDRYDLVPWWKMSRVGNINAQILEVLGTCRYGICYFSEPVPDQPGLYQDNVNVVFEAGMLHGRRNTNPHRPTLWIPIREENSQEAPFDFRAERTIMVPRDENGVDKDALRAQLEALVRRLDED